MQVLQKLLKVAEVAERLNVDESTVYRLLNAGELAGHRVGKRQWRVHPKDVERYLEQRRNVPEQESAARDGAE